MLKRNVDTQIKPPRLPHQSAMGVGKSKLDRCPLSWHKKDSVDADQDCQESHFKNSEDASLRGFVEQSRGAEPPTGEQDGPEAKGEGHEEQAEEEFLKFVILHAEDDTDEALRVQDLLQNDFGIRPGMVFAEMPCGRLHLQNLDDAVNGSAWTILLLTENFLRDTWCNFQFYTSLMNSVNRQHKYNSVIPMRPLNGPLPRERTPLALQTINALEEESQGFSTQVERIFRESVYERQQSIWRETRSVSQKQFIA
ncbi:TIR domain-containing adapter molecule 2 [Mus pahari]|uniref:TIR domain-containing adapter molecule 2 n=1 Tax=Mus pahari TaxID=10093 RepID=UPI000A30EEB6|nr:TIR domain-containing adapter molecule 2 [Mus pahari]